MVDDGKEGALRQRPDGSTFLALTWPTLGIGAALSAGGAIISSDKLERKIGLLLLGGGFLTLGLFFGHAAALQRALWFLPGDKAKAP